MLSEDQIQTFRNDGVLVVDNVLSVDEVRRALSGLYELLAEHGIRSDRLEATGHLLQALSSTNGSGGVLDLFYAPFKLDIATNESLFRMTTQLWEASFTHQGEVLDDVAETDRFKWHPFGPFNPKIGYSYIDRIGYRLPTQLAEKLGAESAHRKGSNKKVPIQRCLTPHLDCCPENRFRGRKWRPIQCFVSLTNNLEAGTGGFEAAKGFHRTFDAWAKTRPPSIATRKVHGVTEVVSFPAPCVGEYTHIRPKEDRDVMDRIEHVPVPAGAAVFWDNRIPHANAYRHDGEHPRCVVYTSFLPDVEINRRYVVHQLKNMKLGKQPDDTWIEATTYERSCADMFQTLNSTQRCLLGLDPWPRTSISLATS